MNNTALIDEPSEGAAIATRASWAKRGIHVLPIGTFITAFRQNSGFSKNAEELEKQKAAGATLVVRHGIKYIPAKNAAEVEKIVREIRKNAAEGR